MVVLMSVNEEIKTTPHSAKTSANLFHQCVNDCTINGDIQINVDNHAQSLSMLYTVSLLLCLCCLATTLLKIVFEELNCLAEEYICYHYHYIFCCSASCLTTPLSCSYFTVNHDFTAYYFSKW